LSSSDNPLIFTLLRKLIEKGETVTRFMSLHDNGYNLAVTDFTIETDVETEDVVTYNGVQKVITRVRQDVMLRGTIDGPLGPDEKADTRIPIETFESMKLRKFGDTWAIV